MSDTSEERRRAMLKTAMGPVIAQALGDPTVIEVMVNPDGKLWIDRLGEGRSNIGVRIHPSETERIIRLVRSEEHTSEHQSLMRISYAVFSLIYKKIHTKT